MKNIFLKTIAAAVLTVGLTGCVNDLDISSIDPQTSQTPNAEEIFNKCYATLGLTGQRGGSGNGDLSDDEGESGFYRTTFNLQELPTDEVMWAWQTDQDIPQITMIGWNSSSIRVQWAYTRLMYDINLFNYYLSIVPEDEANRQNRAEVRFLRALHYWYLLDLFGKVPFKTTFDIHEYPVEYSGEQTYEWLDTELTNIENDMIASGVGVGSYNNSDNFGRADLGAVYMLHARLALNSAVYSNDVNPTTEYEKAIEYCDQLINSNYDLSRVASNSGYSGYAQLFMADNDKNQEAMKEIIFPIRQDGLRTRQYGGSLMLIAGTRIGGMPNFGMTATWSCLFARGSMTQKFFPDLSQVPLATEAAPEGATSDDITAKDQKAGATTQQLIAAAGDDRALLYSGCGGGLRKTSTDAITGFTNGLSIVKWTNLNSDGTSGSDIAWPDTDIPLFRLAEAYLTRAEAKWRLNPNDPDVLSDINELRSRANTRLFNQSEITETTILDEWCREFYLEGRRRSDLRRFGCFTGNKYLWDWKGGSANGISVDSHFDVYPIPATDVMNNPNMTQNDGY